MFSVDSNYMNMALATQKVLLKYPELLKDRKGLLNKIKMMDTYIDGIQKNQVAAEPDSKGATVSKGNAADYAIEMAMDLAGRASVYAEDNGNHVLKAKFDIPKKGFTNVQDVIKVARLRNLIEQLTVIAKESESYDITPEEVNDLEKATSIFEKQLPDPRGIIADRKNHNNNVKSYVVLLKQTMKSMDKLMSKLKGTELFKEYKITRKVIDLGSRKSQGRRKKNDKNKPTDKPDDVAPTEE